MSMNSMEMNGAYSGCYNNYEVHSWTMHQLDKNDTNRHDALFEILIRLDRLERRLRSLEKGDEKESKRNFLPRFLDTVSIVGLKELFLAGQHSIRFIWVIIFLCCCSATGYFVYETVKEYWKEPTATKVRLTEQGKYYEYPVMLLCPDTWLDAEKANADGLSDEGLQYALGFLINFYVRPPPYNIQNYTRAKSSFEKYYHGKNFTDLVEFFKHVSVDSEEFVHRCPFCVNRTFNKILMSNAICYEIKLHATPGNAPVVNGLDYIEVIVPNRTKGLLSHRNYWRLFLGVDLRLGDATRHYAEVYPNKTNTVQFITHEFKNIDKPGIPCRSDEKTYSFARCVLECFLEYQPFLMLACNKGQDCDNSMFTPNRTNQFYEEDFWTQLAKIAQEGGQGGSKSQEAPKHCYEQCPFPCRRVIYTMNVESHTRINSWTLNTWTKLDTGNITLPFEVLATPENVTRLQFLNAAAVYGGVFTFEEVSTYSFETMVGNVGGMLSLWMGVSIMSIIQIFMFFMTEWFPQSDDEKEKFKRRHLDLASGVALLDHSTLI